MFVPLKGAPRPAGLERIPEPEPAPPSGKPWPSCSMRPIGVCLGAEGASSAVLVRIREKARGQAFTAWRTYHLCEACALAGGDREVLERKSAPPLVSSEGSRPARDIGALGRTRPPREPSVWDAEIGAAAEE